MRDLFITWFERLVSLIIIVAAAAVVIGSLFMLVQQGFVAFLAVLVLGTIYVIFVGGAMFLGLGIYQNTKKSAELLEKLANK